MKQGDKKNASWNDVKKRLGELDRAGLIDLIHDLYNAGRDNKLFVHTRFAPHDDALQPYKTVIERWMMPDLMRNQSYSVSKARKAISDYKKSVGDQEGMAELAVFYCECCRNLLSCVCLDDEAYYDALGAVYEQALYAIEQCDAARRKGFIQRLISIRDESSDWGWCVLEKIESLLDRYEYPIE